MNTFGANGLVSRHRYGGYTYLPFPPEETRTSFYTFDERTNVSEETGSDGSLQTQHVMDAYGMTQILAADGTAYEGSLRSEPFGFGAQFGYYTDRETGLVLCTLRYYNPSTGRWLNQDPIGYSGGINLYAYVSGNPINAVDPDGLDALFITGRNRRNPAFMINHAKAYARVYEATHPGKKAHIVSVETKEAFMDAIKNAGYSIDRFEYVGHASGTGSAGKLLLGDDDKKAWITVNDVKSITKTNFTSNVDLRLTGCHTSEKTHGRNSISHAFAQHFGVNVLGYDGGLGFGYPFPPRQDKDARALFIISQHDPRGFQVRVTPTGLRQIMAPVSGTPPHMDWVQE